MVGGPRERERQGGPPPRPHPHAPIEWPIIDLIDESGTTRALSPKTRLTADVSIASLSRVLVPWALI